MKLFALSLCGLLLIANSLAAAAVRVEYRISKAHGLLNFVLAAANEPHQAPGLVYVFERSEFNKADLQYQIEIFRKLRKSLAVTQGLEDVAPGRNLNISKQDRILIEAVKSQDLADFFKRITPLLTTDEHGKLKEIMSKFEPAFDALVWQKNLPALQKHKVELEKIAVARNLDEMFKKAVRFYNANWPADEAFVVGLFPIPYIQGFLHNSAISHSVGSVEEHGVIEADLNYDANFSVIFHEICHSIYNTQSKEFMNTLAGYFLDHPSLYRKSAYRWFNEGLATAVGNGWAHSSSPKFKMDELWYNDPIIDGFAKDIYPLTSEYLNQGKTLDKNYVAAAIQKFEKRFPEAIYLYQDQFREVVVVHNKSLIKGHDMHDALRTRFRVHSYTESAPLSDQQTLASAKNEEGALLVVLTDSDRTSFQDFITHFPFLKKQQTSLLGMKNRNFYSALDEKSRPYLIIRADSKADLLAAMEKIKTLKKINPQAPLQVY